MKNKIYHGDCLDIFKDIDANSIDLILTDPPYQTTCCHWDKMIPLNRFVEVNVKNKKVIMYEDEYIKYYLHTTYSSYFYFRDEFDEIAIDGMWQYLKRIIKKNGAIIFTAVQPFTTILINSNVDMFKYCLVWEKTKAANFMNAKNMPLKLHEDIVVFSNGTCANGSKNKMVYNPQGVKSVDKAWHRPQKYSSEHKYSRPSHKLNRNIKSENYPSSVIKIGSEHNPLHSTQKPVKLMEYLIMTYTNENDVVLDFCIGSGTTAIACIRTNRGYIGIEKDEKYFKIAQDRIDNENKQLKLF